LPRWQKYNTPGGPVTAFLEKKVCGAIGKTLSGAFPSNNLGSSKRILSWAQKKAYPQHPPPGFLRDKKTKPSNIRDSPPSTGAGGRPTRAKTRIDSPQRPALHRRHSLGGPLSRRSASSQEGRGMGRKVGGTRFGGPHLQGHPNSRPRRRSPPPPADRKGGRGPPHGKKKSEFRNGKCCLSPPGSFIPILCPTTGHLSTSPREPQGRARDLSSPMKLLPGRGKKLFGAFRMGFQQRARIGHFHPKGRPLHHKRARLAAGADRHPRRGVISSTRWTSQSGSSNSCLDRPRRKGKPRWRCPCVMDFGLAHGPYLRRSGPKTLQPEYRA